MITNNKSYFDKIEKGVKTRNFDTNYRFVLRKYAGSGSKLQCPRCGRKSFTPYIDTQTNEILDETVGICDHKNSCCYHFSPHDFFEMFPHKKEEYFVRTRTGNYGEAVRIGKRKDKHRSALIACAARTVKHQSISVKHYQNSLNNQQLSAKYFSKSKKKQDISTTKFVSEQNKRKPRKRKIKTAKNQAIKMKYLIFQ